MSQDIMSRLYDVIVARQRDGDAARSYVAALLEEGPAAVRAKFWEEAQELLDASTQDDSEAVLHEAADAVFHLLVLLAAHELGWDAVADELARREGRSGLDEKAARATDEEGA